MSVLLTGTPSDFNMDDQFQPNMFISFVMEPEAFLEHVENMTVERHRFLDAPYVGAVALIKPNSGNSFEGEWVWRLRYDDESKAINRSKTYDFPLKDYPFDSPEQFINWLVLQAEHIPHHPMLDDPE